MGGIEASISRAYIGVVLKAAQMRWRALRCTFSSWKIWYWKPVHHAGQARREQWRPNTASARLWRMFLAVVLSSTAKTIEDLVVVQSSSGLLIHLGGATICVSAAQ